MAEAEQIVRSQREAEMRRRDAKGEEKYKHADFNPGETVLLYVPTVPVGVAVKLYEKWQGPYQVI